MIVALLFGVVVFDLLCLLVLRRCLVGCCLVAGLRLVGWNAGRLFGLLCGC